MSERQQIAVEIAGHVREAEDAIDKAVLAFSRVSGAIAQGRIDAKVSGVVGQRAFASFARAHVALTEARGHAIHGHYALDAVREALKLAPTEASGPVDKPPYDSQFACASPSFTAEEAAAATS